MIDIIHVKLVILHYISHLSVLILQINLIVLLVVVIVISYIVQVMVTAGWIEHPVATLNSIS